MSLLELFKRKEIPKHQNMCIGDGVISLQDACIPLDNICAMEITLPPAVSVGFGILCIVIGIIDCFIPFDMFRILGAFILLIGVGFVFLVQYLNQRSFERTSCLQIYILMGI